MFWVSCQVLDSRNLKPKQHFELLCRALVFSTICLQLFRERLSTKTQYSTMPKGIMGNWGLWSLIEALGVSEIERETAQINESMPSLFLLVNTEPQSINAELFLPIIPIGIVAYAFMLSWDNLCRNSCIYMYLCTLSTPCYIRYLICLAGLLILHPCQGLSICCLALFP